MDNNSDVTIDNNVAINFYDQIVNSDDFNGNYFEAIIQAITLSHSWEFIKNRLKI